MAMYCYVVSNVPKILKWEQITTESSVLFKYFGCFQCSKDTKMGANHNCKTYNAPGTGVVSNVPKILKWEQITTGADFLAGAALLFPMFQRY